MDALRPRASIAFLVTRLDRSRWGAINLELVTRRIRTYLDEDNVSSSLSQCNRYSLSNSSGTTRNQSRLSLQRKHCHGRFICHCDLIRIMGSLKNAIYNCIGFLLTLRTPITSDSRSRCPLRSPLCRQMPSHTARMKTASAFDGYKSTITIIFGVESVLDLVNKFILFILQP
jgi:hypothetical protein